MSAPTANGCATDFVIPYHHDPLAALAERIIQDHQDKLPDLTQVTILLPDRAAIRTLRRRLLAAAVPAGHEAVLGPTVCTLHEWTRTFLPEDIRVCDNQTRELHLVEALLEQQDLLGGANPWSLAEDLAQLFDELTLNRVGLPTELDDFRRQLASAYALRDSNLPAFSHEARIVYTLWHAWRQQLAANGQIDQGMAYLLALHHALTACGDRILYLAGYHFIHQAERDWLEQLRANPTVTILEQTSAAASAPRQGETAAYRLGLDCVYDTAAASLLERARRFAEHHPASPLHSRLAVFNAGNHEEEARAVDIQVRQWLIEGRQRIGIVTENRRLARRVRALLERADVQLEDATGWALSTTSAAATLEALLTCLEEDFSHHAFLDLLKSPFVFADLEADSLQMAVFRLEQDVIRHENIARGLGRYRQHLLKRQQRLPDWMPEVSPTLLGILDRFDEVATLSRPFLTGRHPAQDYLTCFNQCLATLGMTPALTADAAGQRITQLLEGLAHSATQVDLPLNWLDFRSWLGRQLEQTHFKPPVTGSAVRLMGLAQSDLQYFDTLIIAGAEEAFLPGRSGISPFFNQAVRRELGLTTRSQIRRERFRHFRRLLESAGRILITLRHEQDGEPVPASPWLSQLQAFHRLAWGDELQAAELSRWVTAPATQVIRGNREDLPLPARQPRPALLPAHLPQVITASDYQLLMDCPYHFYAARCLKLAAPETIREALAKSDYGQRVHLSLEAFHSGVTGLPGPFTGTLNATTRQPAIDLLQQIASRLFAPDLADNFAHRAWLQLWQAVIPAYIDWQIRREADWQVSQTELQCERALGPHLKIKGRLDRIDHNIDKRAIVDYKTGAVASVKEVMSGEAVQLPFYALLSHTADAPVTRVEYLRLDKPDRVGSAVILENEALSEMLSLIEQRLHTLIQQLHQGEGLPAWPDESKCARCDMQTLCRRQVWETEPLETVQ